MKYQWLEKMAADGQIRKEVLPLIYKDVDALIKEADAPGAASVPESAMGKLMALGMMVGVGMASGLGAQALSNRMAQSAGRKKLDATRDSLLSDPALKGREDLARARFHEIASVAPHVAMNAPVAKRLLHSRLNDGLTDDDIQRLALLQAVHMPNVVQQAGYLPKEASIRPEKMGEIVADVYWLHKTAEGARGPIALSERLKNFASTLGMNSAVALSLAVGGGVANSILNRIDKKSLTKNLNTSFHKAMALSSEKDGLHDSPDKARQAFDALSHFAPHVALEPQAARAFMTKIVQYNQGIHVDDIKALSEIQRNLHDSKKQTPFAMGFGATGKTIGLEKQLGGAFGKAHEGFEYEGHTIAPGDAPLTHIADAI